MSGTADKPQPSFGAPVDALEEDAEPLGRGSTSRRKDRRDRLAQSLVGAGENFSDSERFAAEHGLERRQQLAQFVAGRDQPPRHACA